MNLPCPRYKTVARMLYFSLLSDKQEDLFWEALITECWKTGSEKAGRSPLGLGQGSEEGVPLWSSLEKELQAISTTNYP